MKTASTIIIGAALALGFQGCALTQKLSPGGTGRALTKTPPAVAKVSLPAVEKMPKNTEIGHASWYGPGFHGKKTASGDIFDQNNFTAAHRTLPLGSRVRVTNLANDKSVDVEINDRGPYVGGRVIDLSQAAARALGMVEDGLTQVRIEVFSFP
jgi:rare lipoprotein A